MAVRADHGSLRFARRYAKDGANRDLHRARAAYRLRGHDGGGFRPGAFRRPRRLGRDRRRRRRADSALAAVDAGPALRRALGPGADARSRGSRTSVRPARPGRSARPAGGSGHRGGDSRRRTGAVADVLPRAPGSPAGTACLHPQAPHLGAGGSWRSDRSLSRSSCWRSIRPRPSTRLSTTCPTLAPSRRPAACPSCPSCAFRSSRSSRRRFRPLCCSPPATSRRTSSLCSRRS